MNIQEAKNFCIKTLEQTSPSPKLDAECLLMHILGCDRTALLFKRDSLLSAEQEAELCKALDLRKTGLPVAYITGKKEFYGLTFSVTTDVLIPKPDTELLVELAIERLEQIYFIEENRGKPVQICDMCTGSGCVGITVAHTWTRLHPSFPKPELTLCDISGAALDIARKNAFALIPDIPVEFCQGDLFDALEKSFDLILTNPPYIPAHEARELLKDGRSEPILALDGDVDWRSGGCPQSDGCLQSRGGLKSDGTLQTGGCLQSNVSLQTAASPHSNVSLQTGDGLAIMRRLVPQAYCHLRKGGMLIAESGEYNALGTKEIFEAAGFADVCIHNDLSGQMRDTKGIKEL